MATWGTPTDAIDDDVHRPTRRAARAVDQRRAANDESRKGAVAFVAVGGELWIVALLVPKTACDGGIWRRGFLLRASRDG